MGWLGCFDLFTWVVCWGWLVPFDLVVVGGSVCRLVGLGAMSF